MEFCFQTENKLVRQVSHSKRRWFIKPAENIIVSRDPHKDVLRLEHDLGGKIASRDFIVQEEVLFSVWNTRLSEKLFDRIQSHRKHVIQCGSWCFDLPLGPIRFVTKHLTSREEALSLVVATHQDISYTLLGLDIMFNTHRHPFLLEINDAPQMGGVLTEFPEWQVCQKRMLQDLLHEIVEPCLADEHLRVKRWIPSHNKLEPFVWWLSIQCLANIPCHRGPRGTAKIWLPHQAANSWFDSHQGLMSCIWSGEDTCRLKILLLFQEDNSCFDSLEGHESYLECRDT